MVQAEGASDAGGPPRREDARAGGQRTGVHPNLAGLGQRRFVERAPEILAEETTVNEYEGRTRDLEQLLGKKEVETALLGNLRG